MLRVDIMIFTKEFDFSLQWGSFTPKKIAYSVASSAQEMQIPQTPGG